MTADWEGAKVKDQKQNFKKEWPQFLQDKESKFHEAGTRL